MFFKNCKKRKCQHCCKCKKQDEQNTNNYLVIKQRTQLETKAREEIEAEKWDEASKRVKQTIGIRDFDNTKNSIEMMYCTTKNLFIACLNFHKVEPQNDDNIVSFILMRMLASLFLQIASMLIGGISLISTVLIIHNGILHVINLIATRIVYESHWGAESVLIALIAYILWILHGLLKSTSRELERSKSKTHIIAMFGIILTLTTIIIAIIQFN